MVRKNGNKLAFFLLLAVLLSVAPALSYSNHTLELFPNSSTAISMEELQIDSITSFGAGALAGSSKGHFRTHRGRCKVDNQARKAIVTFPKTTFAKTFFLSDFKFLMVLSLFKTLPSLPIE